MQPDLDPATQEGREWPSPDMGWSSLAPVLMHVGAQGGVALVWICGDGEQPGPDLDVQYGGGGRATQL